MRASALAWVVAWGAVFVNAFAAEPPRTVHGNSDVFAGPGIVIAWGVLRGADEASTTVVVRVATDPASYARVGVSGIDPFTQVEQALLRPTAMTGRLDVRIPRAQFAQTPRTELRLFAPASADAAPALVVYYHGVPDTTPEFTDAAKLDAHLSERIAALRAAGGKSP
jgi:hypothetical protein